MRRNTIRVVGPAAALAIVAGTGIAVDQTWGSSPEQATADRFDGAPAPAPPSAGLSISTPPPGPSAPGNPAAGATAGSATLGLLQIDYTFQRQPRAASNQFAIWLESVDGEYVDTVFATSWIANGGWQLRPMAMPDWRETAQWADATQREIEQASRPAPASGPHTIFWDGLDYRGMPVPAGDYVLKVEGNLEWERMVSFHAPFTLGATDADAEVTKAVDDQGENTMLTDVSVRWQAGEQVTSDMTTEFTRGS